MRNVSKAEALLMRIRDARESVTTIQGWIAAYFVEHPLEGNTTISVPLKGGGSMTVDARIFGEWAAHHTIIEMDILSDLQWSVTHVPSGHCLQIHDKVDEESAVAVAAALAKAIRPGAIDLSAVPSISTDLAAQVTKAVASVLWPAAITAGVLVAAPPHGLAHDGSAIGNCTSNECSIRGRCTYPTACRRT